MKQITIVSNNQPGMAAVIMDALAEQGINIESLDAETFGDTAVAILTVDRYDEALNILNDIPNIRAVSEDAILIRLANKPGALAEIARRFKEKNINLRSMRFIHQDDEQGIVAISTERSEEALALVKDVLIS